jgi:hypothetical protein
MELHHRKQTAKYNIGDICYERERYKSVSGGGDGTDGGIDNGIALAGLRARGQSDQRCG